MPALLAAAGTHCAIVYACFHSNPVDTAKQEKHRHSQMQELGSGTRVDAAYHFQDGGSLNLNIYIYASDTQWESFYTKINGNLQLVCPSPSLGRELYEGQNLTPQRHVKKEVLNLIQSFFSFLTAPSKGKASSFSSSATQQIGKDYTN